MQTGGHEAGDEEVAGGGDGGGVGREGNYCGVEVLVVVCGGCVVGVQGDAEVFGR